MYNYYQQPIQPVYVAPNYVNVQSNAKPLPKLGAPLGLKKMQSSPISENYLVKENKILGGEEKPQVIPSNAVPQNDLKQKSFSSQNSMGPIQNNNAECFKLEGIIPGTGAYMGMAKEGIKKFHGCVKDLQNNSFV